MHIFRILNKCLTVFLAAICLASHATETPSCPPKHEVRAVWLTTFGGLDWPHTYSVSPSSKKKQQQELCDILDKLQAANINTVLLQTRIRGTVIYPSALEPWDGCLSGTPGVSPGYDALDFAISECHKRGMELHAWLVTIPIGKWYATGCKKIRNRYPQLTHRIGNEGYLNPERAGTARYIAEICKEITENYDIDGIHLDYIRYPETWKPRTVGAEKRNNITKIVRQIHRTIKDIKPWVKVSCSPIGKYSDLSRYDSYGWNAYNKAFQDAQMWLKEGIVDALFPMMYFRGNQFYPFALDWKENSYGRMVNIGLGIYFLSPQEKDWDMDVVKREVNFVRQNKMGYAYYRSRFLTDNTKGIYDITRNGINRTPALIPPMTWLSTKRPTAPQAISVKRYADCDELSWSGASDNSGGPYLLYNVYASDAYPVDINNADNLMSMRQRATRATIPYTNNIGTMNYAVTAIDKYGNESDAIYSTKAEVHKKKTEMFMENDGHKLPIPARSEMNDAEFLLVETLQGQMVATLPYKGRTIDIVSLPCGFYVLRTLNKKGVAHRLGLFFVHRY